VSTKSVQDKLMDAYDLKNAHVKPNSIAFCLSGDSRGFPTWWENTKKGLLHVATGMETINYFYSIGIGRQPDNKQLLVKFADALKGMPPIQLDIVDLRLENEFVPVDITCGNGEEPFPWSHSSSKWAKRYYHISKRMNDCYKLIEKQEDIQGWRYEFVSRVRPDIQYYNMVMVIKMRTSTQPSLEMDTCTDLITPTRPLCRISSQ
jgi:hypothetical protein